MNPTPEALLRAALRRDWSELSLESGISVPRLAQLSLRAIDDPEVIAAYPVECGVLARRRDRARSDRSRPWAT